MSERSDFDNAVTAIATLLVLVAVGFGSCVVERVEKTEVCQTAAPKATTLRDSVALNEAGCNLKLSTEATP